LAGGALLGACGGHVDQRSKPAGRIMRVPAEYRTIQAAIDASAAGDTILIAPGVYHRAVIVTASHPSITIRGQSRNAVIFDGRSGRLVTGITVNADHVTVENLTIRRYAVNGLVFAPAVGGYGGGGVLKGWRGSYITAYDNGLYGVYAFQAQSGEFDHVYASGQPDSGIYVGQCRRCAATITASVAADNAVGYEDTNATGVIVSGVVLRDNRLGALLDSNIKEQLPPQADVVLRNSTITGNDNRHAPTGDEGYGIGVAVSGGDDDLIEHNTISGQPLGVLILNASPDDGGYQATDNRVQANTVSNRALDLDLLTGALSQGNCFSGNRPRRSFPINLEHAAPCGRSVPVHGTTPALPQNPRPVNYLTVPAPPPQPTMP
jgi:hypothetical protein